MKKIITIATALALTAALAVPTSAATGGFDIGKAQKSINKATVEIVSKPDFNWSDWLSDLLARWL